MDSETWDVIYETVGVGEAELIRGLLEANQIPVFLSQEGAGKAYGFTLGRLGRIQVLVPVSLTAKAGHLIEEYETGALMDQDSDDVG